LAERFEVTGVDIAARHVELARHKLPHVRFIHADMAALDFAPASFDAVAAFYISVGDRRKAGQTIRDRVD
jgi:ubiquinone/menaquinone biosynthesis C-methylase UbiE